MPEQALVQAAVIEPPPAPLPAAVDLQDLALADEHLLLLPPEPRPGRCPGEDFLGGGVEVHSALREVPQGQGIVALEEEETIPVRQDGEGEGALQLLRHGGQGGVGDLSGLLQQLHRHIGVGLHPAPGQAVAPAQLPIIVEHTVVGQGKGSAPGPAREGVVVLVLLLAALGGHSGVAHEDLRLPGKAEGKPPGGTGGLPDADAALLHPGKARGVGAPDLGLPPKGLDDPLLLLLGQGAPGVQQSKDGAHAHTSSSAATGALV